MSKTSERLVECRTAKHLYQRDVEKLTGITRHTLNGYETERCDISGYALRLLAPCYGVTSDYLLGIGDDKTVAQQ